MWLRNIIILLWTLVFIKKTKIVLATYKDWETIETLAEEYPYVVAIQNHVKDYVCTGTVINKRTVLTSGRCINPEPHYVTVGTAVVNINQNNSSVFAVAFSKLHPDYIFDSKDDLSINNMHSNIGLIFTLRPFPDFLLESANIGNYFASELKEKKLLLIGYGHLKASETLVLQKQMYHHIACKNPKWYYCICGVEYLSTTYEEPFGEGAPVLFNNVVVGVAASPSGSLTLNMNIKYNIFTVIAPYLPWIEKSKPNSILELKQFANCASQLSKRNFVLVINMITMLDKLIL